MDTQTESALRKLDEIESLATGIVTERNNLRAINKDLLEALEALVNYYGRGSINPWIERANTAIAKARGEQGE
jgi:hypothetical protein